MVKDDVADELTQLEELAEALSGYTHPIKLKIGRCLYSLPDSSAKVMGEEIGMPMGRVSYHVRQMASVGLIVQTRLEPVRGAVQRFYALTDLGREWLRRHG